MNQPLPQSDEFPTIEPLEPHNIKLEPSLWLIAKRIGRGNASAGIRFALRKASEGQNLGIGVDAD